MKVFKTHAMAPNAPGGDYTAVLCGAEPVRERRDGYRKISMTRIRDAVTCKACSRVLATPRPTRSLAAATFLLDNPLPCGCAGRTGTEHKCEQFRPLTIYR